MLYPPPLTGPVVLMAAPEAVLHLASSAPPPQAESTSTIIVATVNFFIAESYR